MKFPQGVRFPVWEIRHIVDGDTFDARIDQGFRNQTVQRFRLKGIDTPERKKPGFKEAKEFTREWLSADPETYGIETYGYDQWLRWICLPFNSEGRSLVEDLLSLGLAVPWEKKT